MGRKLDWTCSTKSPGGTSPGGEKNYGVLKKRGKQCHRLLQEKVFQSARKTVKAKRLISAYREGTKQVT